MKIIGGVYRSVPINADINSSKPTMSKARKALFDILSHKMDLNGACVVDLCCGSGVLGFEALSRGANCCIFIDCNDYNLNIAKSNATKLKIPQDKVRFMCIDILSNSTKLLDAQTKIDLVIIDPPYTWDEFRIFKTLEYVANLNLATGCIISLETAVKSKMPSLPSKIQQIDQRIYSKTKITFFNV